MLFPFLQSYNSHTAQPISLGNLKAIHLLKTSDCYCQSVSSINKFRLSILQSQNTQKPIVEGLEKLAKFICLMLCYIFQPTKQILPELLCGLRHSSGFLSITNQGWSSYIGNQGEKIPTSVCPPHRQ